MKVRDFLDGGFMSDEALVFIRSCDLKCLAQGKWYEDRILKYLGKEVCSITCKFHDSDIEAYRVYFDLRSEV